MKSRLVKALSALAVGSMAFSFATAAEAVTMVQFVSTLDVTDTMDHPAISYSSTGLNATLTVGVPVPISQFISFTVGDNAFSASGTPFDITAAFTFTEPTPTGATTDTGSVTGTVVHGGSASETLAIVWPNQPIEFDFADGTKLDVTLQDFYLNCTTNNCLGGPYYMSGTFLVLNGPTTSEDPPVSGTPIPGALPLMASGLGVLGFVGWRRKRRKAAA